MWHVVVEHRRPCQGLHHAIHAQAILILGLHPFHARLAKVIQCRHLEVHRAHATRDIRNLIMGPVYNAPSVQSDNGQMPETRFALLVYPALLLMFLDLHLAPPALLTQHRDSAPLRAYAQVAMKVKAL